MLEAYQHYFGPLLSNLARILPSGLCKSLISRTIN
jgi:hypothetical protein